MTIGEGAAPGPPIPLWAIALAGLLLTALLVRVMLGRRKGSEQLRLTGTRSAWPVYLAASVAIVTIAGLSWWAENRIADRMRDDVGDAVQTVLNTTSKAVYQWFDEREAEARIWAGHEEIQEACQLFVSGESGTRSREAARTLLEEQLTDLVRERGYKGFHLVAPSGSILTAVDERAPVGSRLNPRLFHPSRQSPETARC